MRRIATLIGIAALVAIACDEAPDTGPAALEVQTPAENLIDLLPGSTIAAVEFRDLDSRWDEVRAIAPLAKLQDWLLTRVSLDADAIPDIVGPRTVVAFVPDDASRRIVPIGVLDPPSRAGAVHHLSDSEALFAVEARGALWTGPADHAQLIERIATGDGTSLSDAVDLSLLAQRLPPNGLVRAVVNPVALSAWLRRWADYESANPAGPLARLLAVELEALESCGLRRDIVDGNIVTDVWFGIDDEVVPDEIRRAMATDVGPAVMPADLPATTIVAKSFRTEPEGGLAWLRTLADRDPDGPLRNLEFWIDEFEAWSDRDVEDDIIAATGDRGFALIMEGTEAGAIEWLTILDADEPERLEAALVDLRDWLADQIHGRSFGLAIPENKEANQRGVAHGLDFWSPFGSLSGPVFQVTDNHLVIADSRSTLDRGVDLTRSVDSWSTPAWALADGEPDEIAFVRVRALSRVLEGTPPYGMIAELLAGIGDGRFTVHFQEDGFRMSGELRVGAV
jgi:hypothetical protein